MIVQLPVHVELLAPCQPASGTLPSHIVVEDVLWRVSSCGYSHDTGHLTARVYRVDNPDVWRTFRFPL